MAASARVLVLTPDFPPAYGGIQLLMHRLVAHWTHIDAHVVTLDVAGAEAFDRSQAFTTARVRQGRRIRHPAAIALLNTRSIREGLRVRPDVVLSGHIALSPAAATLHRLRAVPYCQYLHGREVVVRPALSRFGLRRAAAIVAVSSYTASLALAHGARPGSLHRIPPGVDLPAEARERPKPSGRPTVVTVARLEQRYKGHDVLLRALPLVRARIPGARLVVVGDGPLRGAYERLAGALSLDGDVEFAGALDDAERNRVLASANVFAMPSRLPLDGGGEGFGIVYLEAAARGVPVVAGNVAGALDAVVDGETGLLVDPTDHVAVAEAIAELLADPDRAVRMGWAGAARAREFAWPSVAHKVEELLLETAGQR